MVFGDGSGGHSAYDSDCEPVGDAHDVDDRDGDTMMMVMMAIRLVTEGQSGSPPTVRGVVPTSDGKGHVMLRGRRSMYMRLRIGMETSMKMRMKMTI